MTDPNRFPFWSLLVVCLVSGAASAQSTIPIDGPPPPAPPEMIARDAAGRATVRAIKLTEPLRVDGKLDEEVYQQYQPFGGFIQVVPKYGAVQSERTDVWVSYDDRNIYVTCRCWDSEPPDKWIANELRRDTNQLRQNDHIGVMFDTFYDRRSGFLFYTNPLAARADYSVIDEGGSNTDWNPVWESKTGRFDGGWTVEMAIPFKSLRYRSGPNQIWGIQMRRSVRRKNEWAYLTPVPQILAGPQAFNRISSAGTLVGLDLPPAGKNLELKPYALSRSAGERGADGRLANSSGTCLGDRPRAIGCDVGGDVKYGVTANLTADFTVNTDFAQVEIDEQQVNLTRFSLFFPEKRDFFLEGRGVFDFARGGQGAVQGAITQTDQPYLFYSRRIGLNRNRVIPIDAGARLTGKVGKYGIGLMNIQTGDEAVSNTRPTNFTVLRAKRDVLRRSSVGAMYTNRSVSTVGRGSNQAYGLDGAFSFFENVGVNAYWARTDTGALQGDRDSYQGAFNYNADRYGARAEFLSVDKNFNPEVGFIRRSDFTRSFAQGRFSPRPARIKAIRKFTWEADLEYVVNGAGSVESRVESGRFNTELENSDQFGVEVTRDYELLVRPFAVASNVTLPVGGYRFSDIQASYSFGAQRRVSGTISVQAGEFYDGTISSVGWGPGNLGFSPSRISLLNQFSIEPTISINHVDLPAGDFTTMLLRTRTDYGFSPLMFASALLQYSSADRAFSSNLRFRWEYRPGSELFVVYTDERDTESTRLPTGLLARGLKNRAFVVKINRLLRF